MDELDEEERLGEMLFTTWTVMRAVPEAVSILPTMGEVRQKAQKIRKEKIPVIPWYQLEPADNDWRRAVAEYVPIAIRHLLKQVETDLPDPLAVRQVLEAKQANESPAINRLVEEIRKCEYFRHVVRELPWLADRLKRRRMAGRLAALRGKFAQRLSRQVQMPLQPVRREGNVIGFVDHQPTEPDLPAVGAGKLSEEQDTTDPHPVAGNFSLTKAHQLPRRRPKKRR